MPDTTLPTADEVQSWPGLQAKDSAGTVLGTVRSVYGDDRTGVPEWVEVALPDDGIVHVPVLGTTATDHELRLAHAAERIASAPRFSPDAKLEVDDERALYDHYGVEASEELSDTLLPAAADLPGDEAAEPAATPPPARPSRLRRIEQTPAAAVPPPAPLLPPSPEPAASDGSGTGRKAALLLAVPAALLLARRLRGGGLRRRSRASRTTPAAAALVVPAAAGGVAAVLQRRTRRKQKHPAEVGTQPTGPVVIGAASVPADRT